VSSINIQNKSIREYNLEMRLQENSQAIEFHVKDVFDKPISLEKYKGRKVLLSFLRFTGCPVCNLHVYSLLQRKDEIDKKNLAIIFVFESETETIKKYIKDENLPFTFVSDPEQTLYNVYKVEKSWKKLIKWGLTFKGLSNGVKGYLKFNKYSSMKGSSDRVEAEFLIDENGILEKVQYGEMVGDYMPISNYL
jgi:thioredoxin-dependent peroxiredoxin